MSSKTMKMRSLQWLCYYEFYENISKLVTQENIAEEHYVYTLIPNHDIYNTLECQLELESFLEGNTKIPSVSLNYPIQNVFW